MAPAPIEKPILTHPRVSETRLFKRPKQIRSDAPNPSSQTAQKHARSVPAPRPSTAFQPLQNEPTTNLRHRCDSPCSSRIMKTPIPEDSRSTAPNREVSPAVAPLPTSMRVGQEAQKMSISRPTHASSTQSDDGTVQHFDLSKVSPPPATSKQRSPKTGFSLDGSQEHDDSSIDSAKSAASAPASLPSSKLRQSSQSPHLGRPQKYWPPDDRRLLDSVKAALAWFPEERTIPIFDLRMSTSAAKANFEILRTANFDLQRLLTSDESSPLRPGSEFRPVSILSPVFEGHPLWPRVKNSLSHGANLELESIPETDRLTLLETAMSYGNHKSASLHATTLLPQLLKEVEKGWHLPLPIDKLREIPGMIMGPMGAVLQTSIDELGRALDKLRMTHDQSFDYDIEGIKSLNQRVIPKSLSGCAYGFAVKCLVHAVIAIRWMFPWTEILCGKIDYKSAFRRLHLNGRAALQSTLSTKGLSDDPVALASLRVTFGGRPSPSLFSEVSESVTDLANALARCESWDPGDLLPNHSNLIGEMKLEPDTIPLAKARELIVDPKMDAFGLIDVFIDDIISVFPAISPDHAKKCSLAALLAMDVASRPVHPHETVPRDPMLATEKALAEGTPAESQIILGWKFDTRRLLICLPDDKHKAWKLDTQAILTSAVFNKRVKHKDLEKLLGRLQHTASMLPEANHFLNRIRTAEMRAKAHGSTRLTVEARKDLEYWLALLDRANLGIDMNLLVSRLPDFIIRTDACEEGLGGFSLTTGRAWRYKIPQDAQNSKSINYLEFLACIAGIMVSLYDGQGRKGDCFLSLGDNTSSLGWLRKSNFAAEAEQGSHSALARVFATTMAEYGICHFSQWFPGKENDAADILSRNYVTTDEKLTRHIKFVYSKQVSETFRISPLPHAVTSWLDYWVRHKHDVTESPPQLIGKQTSTSKIGSSTSEKSISPTTPFSKPKIGTPSTTSSVHSSTRCERKRTPRVHTRMNSWLQAHAEPPSATYAQPSATKANPIHCLTQMEKLCSFYAVSSRDTPTTTQQARAKNPSHSTSSPK